MTAPKIGKIQLREHLVDMAEPGMVLEVKAGEHDGAQIELLERTDDIGVWTCRRYHDSRT